MKENLLPNYFKKIGLITGIISFILLILIHFYSEQISFSSNQEIIKWIIKDIILISLLFISFAKEKNETEKIFKIRFQRLKQSVIFGGAVLILDSISELAFNNGEIEMKSGYEIMIMIILFYVVTFNFEKNKWNLARA
jgi:hypothetical protein